MSSGADLFVICKHCGAEVSPYITECPYCGGRLRKRAPKLPKDRLRRTLTTTRRRPPLRVLRWRGRGVALSFGWGPPYLTVVLVAAALVLWVVVQAGGVAEDKAAIFGQLHGSWWKLLTYQFAYTGSSFSYFLYGAVTLTATAVFGAALEHRLGPAVVGALFLGAGVLGALAALALSARPQLTGAEGGSAALLAAWLAGQLREGERGEGDIVGGLAFALALAVMPFAVDYVSWTAAAVGAACGAVVGSGL